MCVYVCMKSFSDDSELRSDSYVIVWCSEKVWVIETTRDGEIT